MNPKALFALLTVSSLLGACSSAPTSARTDYADPSFGNLASRRAARETEIRKTFPGLSEKQINEKLAFEFPLAAPQK